MANTGKAGGWNRDNVVEGLNHVEGMLAERLSLVRATKTRLGDDEGNWDRWRESIGNTTADLKEVRDPRPTGWAKQKRNKEMDAVDGYVLNPATAALPQGTKPTAKRAADMGEQIVQWREDAAKATRAWKASTAETQIWELRRSGAATRKARVERRQDGATTVIIMDHNGNGHGWHETRRRTWDGVEKETGNQIGDWLSNIDKETKE